MHLDEMVNLRLSVARFRIVLATRACYDSPPSATPIHVRGTPENPCSSCRVSVLAAETASALRLQRVAIVLLS
jgi:hypothetical protein